MTPQTVNAYYNASNNEIVFPAAILQPPFFDLNADDAVNYGAIGAVIGHEIGHGFDDQGSKSDGDGNLRDWWTRRRREAFEERAHEARRRSSSAINPSTACTSTAADDGREHRRPERPRAGVSRLPDLARRQGQRRSSTASPATSASSWASRRSGARKFRDAALRNQLLTDPHSPGDVRAFVPLTNNDAFMQAFDVKPGDKMYRAPADRVKIW